MNCSVWIVATVVWIVVALALTFRLIQLERGIKEIDRLLDRVTDNSLALAEAMQAQQREK
jgi:hypothetical protein